MNINGVVILKKKKKFQVKSIIIINTFPNMFVHTNTHAHGQVKLILNVHFNQVLAMMMMMKAVVVYVDNYYFDVPW